MYSHGSTTLLSHPYLTELPHTLCTLKDLDNTVHTLCRKDFIFAKCKAGLLMELVWDFEEDLNVFGDHGELQKVYRFICNHMNTFEKNPELVYDKLDENIHTRPAPQ